jgi:hypothetical protein
MKLLKFAPGLLIFSLLFAACGGEESYDETITDNPVNPILITKVQQLSSTLQNLKQVLFMLQILIFLISKAVTKYLELSKPMIQYTLTSAGLSTVKT